MYNTHRALFKHPCTYQVYSFDIKYYSNIQVYIRCTAEKEYYSKHKYSNCSVYFYSNCSAYFYDKAYPRAVIDNNSPFPID